MKNKINKQIIDFYEKELFRKKWYEIYLVDEFRTSKKCSVCDEGICEKFKWKKNKKTHRHQLIHGLIICKNMKCCKIWNRDENGSSNMYRIAKSVIEGNGRPTYLRRT